MMELAVQIVRFVSDHPQPGIVACEFVDADGRCHTLIDKWPMCSSKLLDTRSVYPQPATIRCEELSRWQDVVGREVVQVTLDRPDGIESSEGLSEFVVLSTQTLAGKASFKTFKKAKLMTETNRAAQLYERALSEMKEDRWLKAIRLLKHELPVVQKDWRLSWNLGWCYFKVNRLDDARKHMVRAARLAPKNPTCMWGLGTVYLHKKHYKKAEAVLAESLRIKESHLTRIALALAYLSQGKVSEAKNVHLEGIRLKPKQSGRYESYAAFLSDVGRKKKAQRMRQIAGKLRRVN